MKIDNANFVAWKNDEVTKEVFRALKRARDYVNLSLTNSDIILGDNAKKAIPRLVGQREGLDLILEITCDDLEEDNNEESI